MQLKLMSLMDDGPMLSLLPSIEQAINQGNVHEQLIHLSSFIYAIEIIAMNGHYSSLTLSTNEW